MDKMRAIQLTKPTEAKDIIFTECVIPKVKPGWVLVKIKAFGMNHSEQILRKTEIDASYIKKPIILGIECAGEIADVSDNSYIVGQKVIAFMGGMGRSFDGSYAEFALLPVSHVFLVNTKFSWEQLAAVPETYFTAWCSLFECLQLKPKDKLLIRGGTCALGFAAIQLAKAFGCKIIATTHRKEKISLLQNCGADIVLLDDGSLKGKCFGVTKALELVGPKTLKDTMESVEKNAVVCNTGVLGGEYIINGFDPIKDIPNRVYLTGFYSNNPTQNVMDNIFNFLESHQLLPCIGKVFPFEKIREACDAIDSGTVNGKIVITAEDRTVK